MGEMKLITEAIFDWEDTRQHGTERFGFDYSGHSDYSDYHFYQSVCNSAHSEEVKEKLEKYTPGVSVCVRHCRGTLCHSKCHFLEIAEFFDKSNLVPDLPLYRVYGQRR